MFFILLQRSLSSEEVRSRSAVVDHWSLLTGLLQQRIVFQGDSKFSETELIKTTSKRLWKSVISN